MGMRARFSNGAEDSDNERMTSLMKDLPSSDRWAPKKMAQLSTEEDAEP